MNAARSKKVNQVSELKGAVLEPTGGTSRDFQENHKIFIYIYNIYYIFRYINI